MKKPIPKKSTATPPPANPADDPASFDFGHNAPELSEIDPDDPKGSSSRRILSEDGATCGELGITDLEVTWGAEKFSPVQYMTVDVGPISARVHCEPAELANQVVRRVYDQLNRYANEMFQRKIAEHLERVKIAAAAADRMKG